MAGPCLICDEGYTLFVESDTTFYCKQSTIDLVGCAYTQNGACQACQGWFGYFSVVVADTKAGPFTCAKTASVE